MSDVFVSYKAEDRRRVKPLVEALESDGYSVWWDAQIGGGAAWRHSIETELNAAKCVIVAWSKRSVGPEGTFVQDEATRAQHRHVYVPVLIDKVHLPLGFGETQALPLTGWHGNRSDPRYESVLNAVRRLAGGESPESTPRPVEPTFISRRLVLVGGGVAAAAVAGVGGWIAFNPASAGALNSIAVLPFANLSGDPAQTYFSDGIAEELRSALSRLAGLKVVGRTSSEAVRNDDAETAAEKLGVDNILTGSVRQSPSTIRVSAQLIDGRNGMERWSQSYDRAPGDAIRIQTDIAENVARALSVALGAAERAVLSVGGTNNPEALDQFLRAVEIHRSDHTRSSLEQAIALLDSAIRLDQNYAEAHALRAGALSELTGYFSPSSEWARGFAEAESSARRAIALAPTFAGGHIALAIVFAFSLHFPQALQKFRESEEAGSNDATFLIEYSQFLTGLGFTRKSLPLARKAIDLDPLNPRAFWMEAYALFNARRYEDCIASADRLLAVSPNHEIGHLLKGQALAMLGKINHARAQISRMPDGFLRLTAEAILAARAGDRQASDRFLKTLQQRSGPSTTYQYAQIHAQRGETQQALDALDRAYAIRDPGLTLTKGDPWLDPIRDDPRFAGFLKKVGFPA